MMDFISNKFAKNRKAVICYGLSIFVLIITWQLLADFLDSPLVLPYPIMVWQSFVSMIHTKQFFFAIMATAKRCFFSFLISSIVGLIIGGLCAMSLCVKRFLEPVLSFIRSTPVISIILLALFWLKSSDVPILVSVLMSLPIMISSVEIGLKSYDAKLFDMAKVYKLSKFQTLCFVILPSASVHFIAGLNTSAAMIWKVVAAGEVLSLPRISLGTILQRAQVSLETSQVFAITFVIIICGFLCLRLLQFFIVLAKKIVCFLIKIYFSKNHNHFTISSDANNGVAISIRNLELKREEYLYKDFCLDIASKSVTAILAPSGTGKTTLLNIVAGVLNGICDDACKFSKKNIYVSYLFQETRLLDNLTVLQNVMLPLLNLMEHKDAYKKAIYYINKTGLSEKINCSPTMLSGGEKQRVALCRAFAYPSDVLLMDEAFQSLDTKLKEILMQLFSSLLREQERTVILVTHDENEARCLSNRILRLDGRPVKIVEDICC